MKLCKAVLDIADRLIHLDSLVYGKVILHLHTISLIKIFMSFESFWTYSLMISLECHLKGQLS
jgi:hypothetical protein